MASSKVKADTKEAQMRVGLKKAGKYYSGQGKGSADTQAARGAARRSGTLQALGRESTKRGSAPKKASSTVTPAGRRAANTKGQSTKRSTTVTPAGRRAANAKGQSAGRTIAKAATAAGVATGAAAAAYAAGRVGGRVIGAAGFSPSTLYTAKGVPVMRMNEVTPGSLQVGRTGRDAMGQAMGRGGVKQNPTRLWR